MASFALVALVLLLSPALAQPPKPSVDHQTSYGVISSINEYGAVEERQAITSIDPKLKLYRSDQSTGVDSQGLFANETHLQYVRHGYCWLYNYRWMFSIDYFYNTEYRGKETITTRYFFNETCNRFHGAPPLYDYEFDLYTKLSDSDFIVRQVTYSNAHFRGSVLDHSHYSYDYHDPSYFRFPCTTHKREASELAADKPFMTAEEVQQLTMHN